MSLEQVSARNVSFQGAELPLVQLADCRFEAGDFASCTLDKAYMRRVELIGCRLLGATLAEADLRDVLFARCNANLAHFWNTRFRAVRFEHCTLHEASFDGADLTGAVFYKCDLSGADLRNTRLKGADLRGSSLAGIKINSNDVAGAVIDPIQALELIQLLGVVVRAEDAGT